MNTNDYFTHRVLGQSAIATTMASVILTRAIMNIVRGWTNNDDLYAQIAIYKLILSKHTAETEKIPKAVKRLYARAKREDDNDILYAELGLSPEQAAEWSDALPETDADLLRNNMQDVIRLFKETPASLEAGWPVLSALGQHSLLVAVENALPNKIRLYETWNSDRGAQLLTATKQAQVVIGPMIDQHLEDHWEELEPDADRLPVRQAA